MKNSSPRRVHYRRGMESPSSDVLSATDAAWASSLVRSVAHLEELLPEEFCPDEHGGRQPGYVYGPDASEDDETYRVWLTLGAEARAAERARNRRRLSAHPEVPSLSVIVGAARPDHPRRSRSLASAADQDLDTIEVRVGAEAEVTGLAAAWNAAASGATGDFLAFLEVGDELEPGILADIALTLADDPEIDLLYTDSDSLDEDGQRRRPFFKPAWAPDQLLSHMYLGRLLVVRTTLFREVGGFRPEFEGSHEYDFALRATERARRIVRLPLVGYHQRPAGDSGSESLAMGALEDTLHRRREVGSVEPGLCPGTYRVRRPVRGEPLVSVIVPFHNDAEHLRRCVRSLQETSGYEHWEALLVDNRSWDPGTRALLTRLERDRRIQMLSYPGRFNWAAINNHAVRSSRGAHLLFMNADVEGQSEGWMTAMLEHSQRPEIGAVGARLLYPNGQVQHAGVVMGLGGGVAWHAFCYCPGSSSGYFDQAKVIRNYSAVTGACMMVRYDVFKQVGGFSEDLPVAYNDVDFCLRLDALGLRVVYTPFAELIHDESHTRGRIPPDRHAVEAMTARWGEQIRQDPFYNPNLDLHLPEAAVASRKGGS